MTSSLITMIKIIHFSFSFLAPYPVHWPSLLDPTLGAKPQPYLFPVAPLHHPRHVISSSHMVCFSGLLWVSSSPLHPIICSPTMEFLLLVICLFTLMAIVCTPPSLVLHLPGSLTLTLVSSARGGRGYLASEAGRKKEGPKVGGFFGFYFYWTPGLLQDSS